MIKLEVGDNMILRDDLAIDNYYGALRFYKNMLLDINSRKAYKIREVCNNNGTFNPTNCSWWFSNEMVDWDRTFTMWDEEGRFRKDDSGIATWEKNWRVDSSRLEEKSYDLIESIDESN